MIKNVMSKEAKLTLENNVYFISGDLNFYNVMSVYQTSLSLLKKTKFEESQILRFDFSRLRSSDSAGLALAIEWIKFSNEHKLILRFSHFPKNLLCIAQAARMESLIP